MPYKAGFARNSRRPADLISGRRDRSSDCANRAGFRRRLPYSYGPGDHGKCHHHRARRQHEQVQNRAGGPRGRGRDRAGRVRSAAGTSVAASHSLARAASSSGGSAPSPAGTTSGAATAAANPGSPVAAGSVPFPVAVGNTWVYDVVSNIIGRHTLDTRQVTGVTPVPGGHRVTMSDRLVSASVPNTLQHYLFYDNGQIGFPVSDTHGVSVLSSNVCSGRTPRAWPPGDPTARC
jgi:hypothetical protein